MNDSPTRSPLDGETKGHPVDQRRIVLHVVELGEALRRRGKARIGGDVLDPLAVDEQLAAVAQRLQKLLARTNAIPGFLWLCRAIELRVVPKDAVLVERDPAVRCEIGGDPGQGRNPVVQRQRPAGSFGSSRAMARGKA